MDPTLKVIAQGGTAGLIVALVITVVVLARVLAKGTMVPRKDLEDERAKNTKLEDLLFRLAGITERTVVTNREFVQTTGLVDPGIEERLALITQQLESLHEISPERRTRPRKPPEKG